MKKEGLWCFAAALTWGTLLLLMTGCASEADGSLSPISDEPSRALAERDHTTSGGNADYCVLPVGDFNGDGVGDYVVRKQGATTNPAEAAYVIFGSEESLPEPFDETHLRQRAAYVLRGPASAPFACTPQPASPLPAATTLAAAAGISEGGGWAASLDATSPVGQPVYYTVVDLNQLTPDTYSTANGINAHGQVVGQFRNSQGQEHAYFYDGWEMRDLGSLGGHFSVAHGINTPGEVVGLSLTGETDPMGFVQSAFASDGYAMWDLGMRWSSASTINDAGQIAGEMKVASGAYHAFLYEDGEAVDLGTLGGRDSFARSINEAGQVVGNSGTFIPGTTHPSTRGFVHKNGTMRDLGSLGYTCYVDENGKEECFERSEATDINDKGQIAGFSTTSEGPTHAFLATGGTMEDLGTLGGQQSWAHALNDSRQVVGTSLAADGSYHPFLFDRGTMFDLNALVTNRPDNFAMWGAHDINNFGQIVGVNYLLNPNYESIAPGRGFSFSDRLGRQLTFEYWVSTDDAGLCDGRRGFVQIEVRIEADQGEGGWPGSGRYLNRWLPADSFAQGCADSENWRRASIPLPPPLQEQEATVMVRLKKFDAVDNPTIYLRHFSMK